MTAAAPSIDQLRELAVPAPLVSYWPQTWGWLVLLLVLLLIAGMWATLRWRRWQRDRYRREALARLDTLGQALADPERRLPALRELPVLLKRVALSMPNAPEVAGLGGVEWQAFLARSAPRPLPEDFAAQLFTVAYAPDAQVKGMPDAEVRALFSTSRHWIEAHRVAV
ncbi:DUF4381 domain-containing protein [Metapseudomonas resinovorans]|uniref:Alpha-2 type XI collagen n=1 Tax=Metapseudomonas resinovorans NBRC 106553 TaxID=1245471 RepID=S6ARB8_METRE|nr:DUF4381 domain-containing protein [Pseudomonas resinovorans]BAN48433.1 hypothetical protein PCA10_27010 [Pseudomonas resinovorans NBRC 106553]